MLPTASSTSAAGIFSPLRITMSFSRPTMRTRPVDELGHVAGAKPLAVESACASSSASVYPRNVCGPVMQHSVGSPTEPIRTSTSANATPSSAWRTALPSVRRPDVLIGTSDEP